MMWTLKKRGSLEQNLQRVAEAGYRHVELVDEYKSWTGEEWTRLPAQMARLGLSVDAVAGMKLGFADPAGGDAFLAELKTLIPVAKRLSSPQIILLSGKRLEGVAREEQQRASVATLKRSADLLAAADLQGVIEPIDLLEQPGIYLDGVTEAFAIVQGVGSPALKVLYDLYHEQRGHGNLIEKLQSHLGDVGLIHVADVPGRHQPGTGEIDYGNIYRVLRRNGYAGVVAMEFYPDGDVVETLRSARLQIAAA